jgi:hypothetical protein
LQTFAVAGDAAEESVSGQGDRLYVGGIPWSLVRPRRLPSSRDGARNALKGGRLWLHLAVVRIRC